MIFTPTPVVELFKVNPVQLWFWFSLVLIGWFCLRVRRVGSHHAAPRVEGGCFVFGLGQKLTKQVEQQQQQLHLSDKRTVLPGQKCCQ